MRKFEIPQHYRSSIISRIKESRKNEDPRKKNFTPTILDFGQVRFFIARHFGFCYGVENAIEIAYKTIEENSGKTIYLLSEIIHNPGVNEDLLSKGVKFLMDTAGNRLIDWNDLKPADIVIIPAFGTTIEIQKKLSELGVDVYKFNTTCPFVEKVWNRSEQLGKQYYTIVIHGKNYHEETRATFSHTVQNSPSVIVRDLAETKILGSMLLGKITKDDFEFFFKDKLSENFNAERDLQKIGVVNQTTMLSTETQQIADFLKNIMIVKYGFENINSHFADTRDTLCYATYDNQQSTFELINQKADLAVVIGGYNSSNTSHIVELCQKRLPTYFVSSADKIISDKLIKHFDLQSKAEKLTENFLPADKFPVDILLTSGASCPDADVEKVLQKILSYFSNLKPVNDVVEKALSL